MHGFSKTRVAALLAAASSVTFGAPARAQEVAQPAESALPEAGALTDIVVTAQKRETRLQRTPIAVTALNGDALRNTQVTNLQTVAAIVPSFKAGQTGGFAQITIRGIGIQNFAPLAESAVAVNLNQIYVSRPSSFLTGLFDVSAIEVLRGPQGTLYGRNATAGSVNLTTTRPTDVLSGFVNVSYGNYDAKRIDAAIGGPLVNDKLLVRVAGFYDKRHGYGRNIATGSQVSDNDSYGVRGTVVLAPTPNFKATLIAEHYREKDAAPVYNYFGNAGTLPVTGTVGAPSLGILLGGTVLVGSRNVSNDVDPSFHLRVTTLTGQLEWGKGPFSLRSITGYRTQKLLTLVDLDGSNLPLAFALSGEPARQFSQELQAHYDTDHLHVTLGGYYYRENDAATPFIAAFNTLAIDKPLGIPQRPAQLINFANLGGTIRTRAKAVFGEATWEFAQGLSLTAGVRHSTERKQLFSRFGIDVFTPYSPSLLPPPDVAVPTRRFTSTTPKVGISFQVTPRTLLYATYAQGFKSGSFDASTLLSFAPEKLKDFEVGLKTTLLDGHLRANLAGFYYDYTNLQVQQTIGLGLVTANAGKARLYGVEGEFTFLPVPPLELSLNASYLNSRYTGYLGSDSARPLLGNVDFSGNRLNNAPSFSGSGSAQYTWKMAGGSVILRGEGEFTTKYYFSPGNYDLVGQSGYAKVNAFVSYNADKGWSVTAFVRNLTNKKTKTSAVIQTALLLTPVQGSYAPPRTYGVQLAYRF